MKYLCLIPDGASDHPCPELGGRTPLEAADIPNIRSWAAAGAVGAAANVPPGFPPGSDVAITSILGLDPNRYFTGRAPLEAAAMGIPLPDGRVAYRCNLVTVEDGVMRDFSAGHIGSDDSHPLIAALQEALGSDEVEFYPGVGYRHICVLPETLADADCRPPHDLADREAVLPEGPAATPLIELMDASKAVLAGHPVNKRRIAEGCLPATQIWLWGQGIRPEMEGFEERYGICGSIITAVDLVRGLGVLTGLEIIEVPGATGYYDTNYRGKAEYALSAVDRMPFCLVHVESTDEAGHEGDAKKKVQALEDFDRLVAGRIREGLEGQEYRMLLLPDHPTPCDIKTHTADPVPYVLFDSTARGAGGEFTEAHARALQSVAGHELLGMLITGERGPVRGRA